MITVSGDSTPYHQLHIVPDSCTASDSQGHNPIFVSAPFTLSVAEPDISPPSKTCLPPRSGRHDGFTFSIAGQGGRHDLFRSGTQGVTGSHSAALLFTEYPRPQKTQT